MPNNEDEMTDLIAIQKTAVVGETEDPGTLVTTLWKRILGAVVSAVAPRWRKLGEVISKLACTLLPVFCGNTRYPRNRCNQRPYGAF